MMEAHHPWRTVVLLIALSFLSRMMCLVSASLCSFFFSKASLSSASNLLDLSFPPLFNTDLSHGQNRLTNSSLSYTISPTTWSLVQPYLHWDSEYFFSIATQRLYAVEYHHAFFPGYPWILTFVKSSIVPSHWITDHTTSFITIIIGLIISNVSFIGASIGIFYFSQLLIVQTQHYLLQFMPMLGCNTPAVKPGHTIIRNTHSQLTLEQCTTTTSTLSFQLCQLLFHLDPHRTATISSLMFIVSPANIFMSSLYSESFFACITIWAFNILILCELSLDLQKEGRRQQCSLPIGTRSLTSLIFYSNTFYSLFYFFSVILLGYGAFTRSNGTLSLVPLFFFTLRTCPIIGCKTYGKLLQKKTAQRASSSSVPRTSVPFLIVSKHFRSFSLLFCHWFIALFSAIIVILPFISILGFAFRLYCTAGPHVTSPRMTNELDIHSPTIPNMVPIASLSNLTSHFFRDAVLLIQATLSKFNLLSSPSVPLMLHNRPWCTYNVPNFYKFVQSHYWNVRPFAYWSFSKLDRFFYSVPYYISSLLYSVCAILLFYPTSGSSVLFPSLWKYLYCPYFGYLIQLIIITIYMGCIANVEVIIRMLVSGTPLFFTFLGISLSVPRNQLNYSIRVLLKFYTFFHIFCHIVGPPFFAVWMTWT